MRHMVHGMVLGLLLLGLVGPATAGDEDGLDEGQLKALIAEAASMSPRYMRTLTTLGLRVDLRKLLGHEADVPFTAAVIALAGEDDLLASDWHWLDAATPRDFLQAIYPIDGEGPAQQPRHAKASVLHEEAIRTVAWEVEGSTATGLVAAQVDGIYRCSVAFRAERAADGWRIVELGLPGSGVRTTLEGGRWRLHLPRGGTPGLALPALGTVGQEPPQGQYCLVTVTAAGDVFYQGEPERISIDQLRARLSEEAADPRHSRPDGSRTLALLLDMDRSTPWAVAQWLMTTAAQPEVRIHKIYFRATAVGSGAEGALAAHLPRDRSGPTPWAGTPGVAKVKVKVFSGTRATSDPRAVYAALLRLPEADRARAVWELVAPPPMGGRTPYGDVLALLDVMLAAGAQRILFEGAAFPADPAAFSSPEALRAVIAQMKQSAGNTFVKVGPMLITEDAPTRDIPQQGRVERVIGAPAWGDDSNGPFPLNETETLEETPAPSAPQPAAPRAGGGFASRGGAAGQQPLEEGKGTPRLAEQAVDAALRWLAAHQSPHGGWDAQGFGRWCEGKPVPWVDKQPSGPGKALYDPGVTGLALCAFLGAGYTNRGRHPFAKVVSRGLRYLKNVQDPEGCFGPRSAAQWVYNHATAALAMVEAYGMTGSPIFKGSAQRALDFIALARNPYRAWRYGVKSGENDTSVSAFMLLPLKSAQIINQDAVRRGKPPPLTLDESAFDGMRAWLDAMTGPDGRVGYIQRGGSPARPQALADRFPPGMSESMTAAGVLARILLGAHPRKDPTVRRGLDLMAQRLPSWNVRSGAIDMIYWHWGMLAAWQAGGTTWEAWEGALRSAVLAAQRQDTDPCLYRGSWDPLGPWGADGGRVYATALMCLCCEVYYRYPR